MDIDLKQTKRLNLQYVIAKYYDGDLHQFSEALEKPVHIFSRILNGDRNLGKSLANEIEKKVGLLPGWLNTQHSDITAQFDTNHFQIHQVPLFSWKEILNVQQLGDENITKETVATLSPQAKDAFAIKLTNDFLQPYYPKDSILIFLKTAIANHHDIVLIGINGKCTVCELMYEGNLALFHSLNLPQIIYQQESVDIIGKLIDVNYLSLQKETSVSEGNEA